jgi:hypothetical protein
VLVGGVAVHRRRLGGHHGGRRRLGIVGEKRDLAGKAGEESSRVREKGERRDTCKARLPTFVLYTQCHVGPRCVSTDIHRLQCSLGTVVVSAGQDCRQLDMTAGYRYPMKKDRLASD